VLKLPFLVDLQQEVGELFISRIASPLIIILKKRFKLVKTCGYGNFSHRYNVSLIHLYAVLGVGKFTVVVRVCADRL
jgi:hypothetical protein